MIRGRVRIPGLDARSSNTIEGDNCHFGMFRVFGVAFWETILRKMSLSLVATTTASRGMVLILSALQSSSSWTFSPVAVVQNLIQEKSILSGIFEFANSPSCVASKEKIS